MAFLLGVVVGAAAGAIVALLTTPKPGREMRDELAVKARDAAERAREEAGEWVPLFQREPTNGGVSAAIDATASPMDAPAEPVDTGAPIDTVSAFEPADGPVTEPIEPIEPVESIDAVEPVEAIDDAAPVEAIEPVDATPEGEERI
ncbi:MAG TPA: YtxH domain-containing protein [Candidatus Limnocylindria bacterium]|nr:YtxH domain-containing protein [Candidatus Limnocylindria bacterium]